MWKEENCGALQVKCIKKSTTEPEVCPGHCWEHDKCGYDALPNWCEAGSTHKEC